VKRSDSISLLVPPKGINVINPTLSAIILKPINWLIFLFGHNLILF
jgi:hypothetical protein